MYSIIGLLVVIVRIIVDLRDKVGESVSADTRAALPGMAVADFDEALAALTMLGFERKQSQKVLRALYDAEPVHPRGLPHG